MKKIDIVGLGIFLLLGGWGASMVLDALYEDRILEGCYEIVDQIGANKVEAMEACIRERMRGEK
jgi:hypothetical protein